MNNQRFMTDAEEDYDDFLESFASNDLLQLVTDIMIMFGDECNNEANYHRDFIVRAVADWDKGFLDGIRHVGKNVCKDNKIRDRIFNKILPDFLGYNSEDELDDEVEIKEDIDGEGI